MSEDKVRCSNRKCKWHDGFSHCSASYIEIGVDRVCKGGTKERFVGVE